jgi:hypothetical protein
VLGTLFFAASLTPSLTPRITVAQAVLSGMCLAAGYGLGVLLRWLWGYLELPLPGPAGQPRRRRIAVVACAVIAALALWRSQHWGKHRPRTDAPGSRRSIAHPGRTRGCGGRGAAAGRAGPHRTDDHQGGDAPWSPARCRDGSRTWSVAIAGVLLLVGPGQRA